MSGVEDLAKVIAATPGFLFDKNEATAIALQVWNAGYRETTPTTKEAS